MVLGTEDSVEWSKYYVEVLGVGWLFHLLEKVT